MPELLYATTAIEQWAPVLSRAVVARADAARARLGVHVEARSRAVVVRPCAEARATYGRKVACGR